MTASKAKSFKITLSGGSTYDDLKTSASLPDRIKRIVFKSASSADLNLKLGGSTEILTLSSGDIYDSEWCDMQDIDIKINGTGDVDGEYWV